MTLRVEPAPAGAAPGVWKQVARGWLHHVAHPVPRSRPPFADRPWAALLSLLSMATPLALIAAVFVAPFGDDVGLRSRLDFRFTAREALLVLVIAPCIEELVFRGPLGSRRAFERALLWVPLAAMGLGLWWLAMRAMPGAGWPLRAGAGLLVLAGVLAAGLWLDDRLERWRFTRVDADKSLFARHFPAIAHAATLAFALAHSSNYVVSWSALWFLPLAVLPQLVLGYACVYARATIGLHGAMLLHSAHNAVAYSIASMAQ